MKPRKTVMGLITNGTGRLEYMAATIEALRPSPYLDGRPWVDELLVQPCGPYLDDGRNQIVERFLNKTDAEILLFVDDDIAFTLDDVRAVVEAVDDEHPIVGGAYYSPQADKFFTVAYEDRDDNGIFTAIKTSEVLAGSGLRPVLAIGTGFLAIQRNVLETMPDYYDPPQPWFAELVLDGVHLGEDLTFCVRAKALGFDSFLQQDAKVTHYKTVGLAWSSLAGIPLSEVE